MLFLTQQRSLVRQIKKNEKGGFDFFVCYKCLTDFFSKCKKIFERFKKYLCFFVLLKHPVCRYLSYKVVSYNKQLLQSKRLKKWKKQNCWLPVSTKLTLVFSRGKKNTFGTSPCIKENWLWKLIYFTIWRFLQKVSSPRLTKSRKQNTETPPKIYMM